MSVNEIVQLGERLTVIENFNLFLLNSLVMNSIEIVKLGEHQTEDLKAPGLNPENSYLFQVNTFLSFVAALVMIHDFSYHIISFTVYRFSQGNEIKSAELD